MSITTYLMGGCCNQVFQWATGFALARRLNTDLYLDVSRYDAPSEQRMYSLGLFKGVEQNLVRSMNGRVIRESGMPYNPALFENIRGDVTLYGYWQTEQYFKEIREELSQRLLPKEWLSPQHSSIEHEIIRAEERSVFLTVRRTDYVGNDFHGLLPMIYYLQAAHKIASEVIEPIFFVFSDEPEWCRENFKLPYKTIIAGNFDRTVKPHLGREDAELFLMRQCRHAVMANSSYSWWGAWLGADKSGGIVVAPKNWFGPKGTEDSRDICPERWIKL